MVNGRDGDDGGNWEREALGSSPYIFFSLWPCGLVAIEPLGPQWFALLFGVALEPQCFGVA